MRRFAQPCLVFTLTALSGCDMASSPRSKAPGIDGFEFHSTGGSKGYGSGMSLRLSSDGSLMVRFLRTYTSPCPDSSFCTSFRWHGTDSLRSQLDARDMARVDSLLTSDAIRNLTPLSDTGTAIEGAYGWSATVTYPGEAPVQAVFIPRKCGNDGCPKPHGYALLDSLANSLYSNALPKILL